MKRKLEDSLENQNKARKLNLEDQALQLIQQYKEQLTANRVEKEFPNLSLSDTHTLLTSIKNDRRFMLPGIAVFVKCLFTHLLTSDYNETDHAFIHDLCILLNDFQSSDQLPRIEGRIFNTWLRKLDWNNPAVLQHCPLILHSLELMIPTIIFSDPNKDYFDMLVIDKGISSFVNTFTEQTVGLVKQIPLIFSALNKLLFFYRFIGKLSASHWKTLFLRYQQENPEPEQLSDIANTLLNDYLMNIKRCALIGTLPVAVLMNALTCVAKVNTKIAIDIFLKLVTQLYGRHAVKPEPVLTEQIQPLINCIIEKNCTSTTDPDFVCQVGHLINNGFLHGKIDGLEKILLTLSLEKNVCLTFQAMHNWAPALRTPLNLSVVERFLRLDNLHPYNKALSIAFSTIYSLSLKYDLAGSFTIDVFVLINSVIEKKLQVDTRLTADTLRFLGICLLNKHIDMTSSQVTMEQVNKTVDTLLFYLHTSKVSDPDMIAIVDALKFIAKSEFTGSFNVKYLDSLIRAMLDTHSGAPKYGHVANYLHTLGIAGRNGLIKNFPTITIENLLDAHKRHFEPYYTFKTFTAVSDLITSGALNENIHPHYLKRKFAYILSRTIPHHSGTSDTTKIYWRELSCDVPHLLQFPEPLNQIILLKLMPFMVEMLQNKPDKTAVEAIFNTLKQLPKIKHLYQDLSTIDRKDFNELANILNILKKDDVSTLLHLLIIAVDLSDSNLMDSAVDFPWILQTLIKILPSALLTPNITSKWAQNTLHEHIDILSILIKFIKRDMPDSIVITDIFDAIQLLMTKKIVLKERIWSNEKRFYRERSLVGCSDLEEKLVDLFRFPYLKTGQCVALLKGLANLLTQGLLPNITFRFLFTPLEKLDTATRATIASEDCYAAIMSDAMMHAVSTNNKEDVEKLLPLVHESNHAPSIMIKACEKADLPIVHLLLQSGYFLDSTVQAILHKAYENFKPANNPETFILLVFTLLTYRGIDSSFVNTAMQCTKHLIQKLGSELQPRIENVIQYSLAKQHGMFSAPKNNTLNIEDAEKILRQAPWYSF